MEKYRKQYPKHSESKIAVMKTCEISDQELNYLLDSLFGQLFD